MGLECGWRHAQKRCAENLEDFEKDSVEFWPWCREVGDRPWCWKIEIGPRDVPSVGGAVSIVWYERLLRIVSPLVLKKWSQKLINAFVPEQRSRLCFVFPCICICICTVVIDIIMVVSIQNIYLFWNHYPLSLSLSLSLSIYLSIYLSGPVSWGCRIHRLHLLRGVRFSQRVSWYDTEQSDGEASVMPELWGIRSTPLLPKFPGSLFPRVVALDISWYALENNALSFESCLREGNDGWMRAMLILRRYLLKKKKGEKGVCEPMLV